MAKKQGSDNVTPVKKIAALVIAKNEATMLAGCLSCLGWCDEIVVLDNGSTDNTALIAEQFSARVIHFSHSSFARLREEVIKHTQAEWVLYIDADERVLPMLAREIAVHMEMGKEVALQF
nr:glycosyltransferase [Candidatus Woesebacteria bacterium]